LFQRMTQPPATPAKGTPAKAIFARRGVDPGSLRRPEFRKTVAELADPMQSETVKGWLLSDLRAPK
jgi:hypothetical protein